MKKYEFSAPMPYRKEHIDRLVEINNQVEKSQITNLYFNLPVTCDFATPFEQQRNLIMDRTDFDYWKELISYSLEKGFDFIYLINSPRRLEIERPDFMKDIEKLQKLLSELKKLGVNKLRVSNVKLLTYLSLENKDFELYASTSFEYKTIKEYQNFIAMHPTVKQIVPSHDIIKNFRLLNNLKKSLPNTDIEIMVNEGCMGGCPHRLEHSREFTVYNIFHKNTNIGLTSFYCSSLCTELIKKNIFMQICKANVIYPWEIDEYGKLGFTKFKLVGRDAEVYSSDIYINIFFNYLKGVDDIKNIMDTQLVQYIHHIAGVPFEYTVKELYEYLPNIEYFKKYGHLCSSDCGIECRYCYDCAKKMKNYIEGNNNG